MITSCEIISLPFRGAERLPVVSRTVSLYPDRHSVWKHHIGRMSLPCRDIESIYGNDAGLQQETPKGGLVDLYA